jgi:invasion protein IalB
MDARTDGRPIVAASLIEPEGRRGKFFRVALPRPLQEQDGARLTIDKEPTISTTFSSCVANACYADYEGTPELIGKLKNGQMLQVQATSAAAAVLTFPLPLVDSSGNSFARANEGPPTDPQIFQQRQKELQERLQRQRL